MGSPANKGDSLSSLITVCGLLRIVEGILTWNEVSLCSGGIGITSIDVIENRICTAQTGIEIIHDIPGGDMYRRPGIQIRIIRDSSSCLETISAGIGEFHSIITFRNILEPGSKAICYFIRLILGAVGRYQYGIHLFQHFRCCCTVQDMDIQLCLAHRQRILDNMDSGEHIGFSAICHCSYTVIIGDIDSVL